MGKYDLPMRSRDTSLEAHRRQLDICRRMDPARRVELAWRMSEEARAVAAAGIRARHPDYSEAEVRRALARLVLGDALASIAWSHDPLPAP